MIISIKPYTVFKKILKAYKLSVYNYLEYLQYILDIKQTEEIETAENLM